MFKQHVYNNHILLIYPEYEQVVDLNWFNASFWQQQNKIVGAKKGRATAWFFQFEDLTAVLRHKRMYLKVLKVLLRQ